MSRTSNHCVLLLSVILTVASLIGCDSNGPSDEGGSTTLPPPLPQAQSFPRWSPDGDRILYYDHGLEYDPESDRVVQNPDLRGLWTMRPDGTNRRHVLAGGSLYGDWSPGGDSLVFEADAQVYKAAFKDGVVDTASIVQLSPPGRFFDPDWGPSGKRVAYRNSIGDTTGVWISPADGSQSKEYFVKGGTPQWFPGGQRLLFTCGGLCLKAVDHSFDATLFTFDESDQFSRINGISIAPGGDKIAVGMDRQVWVMNSDGANKRKLTHIAERWHSAGQPDWSPEGDRIVYIGPEHTIWMMNAGGTDKEQITTIPRESG